MENETNRVEAAEKAAEDFEGVLEDAEDLPLEEVLKSEAANEFMRKLEFGVFKSAVMAQEELSNISEGLSKMEVQRLQLEISKKFEDGKSDEAKAKDKDTFKTVSDDEISGALGALGGLEETPKEEIGLKKSSVSDADNIKNVTEEEIDDALSGLDE